ncbi:MAG TPA: FIST N-terminal domain-containing protein [Pyrinomonadaceae bacterium]
MNSYAAFIYGALTSPSGDNAADGRALARQCITQLEEVGDRERFPPRLLILLTSPAYLEMLAARQLLSGIEQEFRKENLADGVALVGSSAAAVFFDNRIHEEGALLICLSSLLLETKAGVGRHASRDPEAATEELLKSLGMGDRNKDLNPLSNRMLLTFFPDINRGASGPVVYRSDELHRTLWKKTHCRIPIAGGISAAGTPRETGPTQALQYCNWEVYSDAVVAAQVDSGVPLGVSLCRGLETVRDDNAIVRRRVKDLSEDGLYVDAFFEGSLDGYANGGDGLLLLGEDSKERDFIMALHEPAAGGRFRVMDKLERGETLRVLRPHPEQLLRMAGDIVRRSTERVRVRHPLGCLSFICSAHLRRRRQHVSLYIEQAIKSIGDAFGGVPCVGGFVDGEAGVDETGRSQFGNWSMVGLILGDEMRDRTPLYRGFKALAKYNHGLTAETDIGAAIGRSLELVYETDFPGVMISTLLPDQEDDHVIVQGAKGKAFAGSAPGTRIPITVGDPLHSVIADKRPLFMKAEAGGACTGQYIVPLKDLLDDIIAVMHVDLGRVSPDSCDVTPVEREVLTSLGAAISAGVNDILNWRASEITRELDRGLKESISAATMKDGLNVFVRAAVAAFGADMGHVRLSPGRGGPLELKAGVGDYYEVARRYRAAIRLDDVSPTCETFYSGGTTVVNDAWNNAAHNRLRETVPDDPVREALREVRSYANTAFKNAEGETLGTINLLSKSPWFFTQMHRQTLGALAERVEFLVQHLEQKEQKEQINRGIKFLRNATPQLSQVNVNDMPGALREATQRFCEAAGAEVASLYLFDKDLNKYVLRAQHNWADGRWVNVARYERDGGWLWNVARQPTPEPQIFRDRDPAGLLYSAEMFGGGLGPDVVASAAGLPLTLGDENLGLLVLYVRHPAGEVAEFATIDTKDLQEAASSMAALVRILFFSQEKIFGEKMQRQFKKLSDIFLQEKPREVIEADLCENLVGMFQAHTADFYFYPPGGAQELLWIAGHPRPDARGARPAPDATVRRVGSSGVPIVFRHGARSTEEHKRFESAAVDGLVTRICIPVGVRLAREGADARPRTGVLDVVWDGPRRVPGWEAVHHSERQLQIMGSVIGSSYSKYRLTVEREEDRRRRAEEDERNDEMKRLVNNMRSQASHVTKSILQAIKGVPNFIRADNPRERRESYARKLAKVIDDGSDMIKEILDSARAMTDFKPRPCRLKLILEEAVERVTTTLYSLDDGQEIEMSIEAPDSIEVYVDDRYTKQAFYNLINNAIEATTKKHGSAASFPPHVAASVAANEAEVLIIDRGTGLTQEQIKAAKTGDLKTEGKTGTGIFFSRGFIINQKGTHDMFPNEYGGITVRVTLPLNPKEELDGNYSAGDKAQSSGRGR